MKKLYLTNWSYNAALIMEELKKIIENNGGTVATPEPCEMINRSLNDAIRETEERINQLIAIETENEKRTAYIKELKNKLSEYKKINNVPIVSLFAEWHYIKIHLNNVYYYFQFDDNPFFPFYFNKIKLDNNNSYSGDYCMEEFKKEDWLFDCFFKAGADHEDIKEAANLIYNQLMIVPYSIQYKEKKRVYNLYDGGYHYEYIPTNKNRKITIDF